MLQCWSCVLYGYGNVICIMLLEGELLLLRPCSLQTICLCSVVIAAAARVLVPYLSSPFKSCWGKLEVLLGPLGWF